MARVAHVGACVEHDGGLLLHGWEVHLASSEEECDAEYGRDHDIDVRLVRMHRTVYQALDRGGAIDELGSDSILRNPEDALPQDD